MAEAQIAKEKKENPIISAFRNLSRRIRRSRDLRIKRKLEIEREKLKLVEGRRKIESEREKELEIKKTKKEEEEERREEGRKGLVGKCRKLIEIGYKVLERNDGRKADKIYVK